MSSLVCDPEDCDFHKLDQVPSDKAIVFVVATYGEGDPTDNAQPFWEFLMDENVEFSSGSNSLENLNYVVFGLGNRTYEHFNEVARRIDKRLTELGAHRIGERGEGDDDKALEEDYLGWKDDMWEDFAKRLELEEGGAGDVADFVITEVDDEVPAEKVYHGELSARALAASASGAVTPVGSYNSKNPYPSPVGATRELFAVDGERNCVHIEFDLTGSGITYQHGDHVGVWPSNPDMEVERMLSVLGLSDKRHTAIGIESLDPALAKVPFPVPATYEAVFRHYLDVSSTASRQTVGFLARYAPNEKAREALTRWGNDKAGYAAEVDGAALKLAEVLQAAAGDDLTSTNATVWPIPFDRIVSSIPRLQPRYYSISSSSKLYPASVHVTAVVLKYASSPSVSHLNQPRWVYGVSTNFILNVKRAHDTSGANTPNSLQVPNGNGHPHTGGLVGGESGMTFPGMPTYKISGPRDFHSRNNIYRVPIHVRRSAFRLPTSPKIPIIMIGPGTGVAPFRGFVQERVALARRAREKNGENAIEEWAPMYLFYGCRREDEDFLYREEWPEYIKELDGKLIMKNAFSRGPDRKPDGSESSSAET
jgi:NADPH-ferrihemoprotein reductase